MGGDYCHKSIARALKGNAGHRYWDYRLDATAASDLLDEWEDAQKTIRDQARALIVLRAMVTNREPVPPAPPAWTVIA